MFTAYWKSLLYGSRSIHTSSKANWILKECFVNGKWVNSLSGQTFNVYNPANGKVIEQVPNMDIKDVEIAVTSAHNAFKCWSTMLAKERSKFLRNLYDVVNKNCSEIAKILCMESGKSLEEAAVEVNYGNSFIEWYSEECRRYNGEIVAKTHPNKELIHIKEPIGVAALITPWNFPLAMITRKAGAALATGCTCVVRPAEDTPLTALAFAKCIEEAGIPEGVLNVVTSDRSRAGSIGNYFCKSEQVAGITFTGSTAVGKILYEQCAAKVKRLSLELGGNAPFIVFKSAKLEKAVEGAASSKFRNCGQTCVSSNRFLIQESVFEEFVHKVKKYIEDNLELGDPLTTPDGKKRLGPLINKAQLEKVDGIVQDAIRKGAVHHCGGKRATQVGELYYEPTLLTNITPDMKCYKEEIFGPVISCIKFHSEEEALEIANDSRSGLAGYFYSSDLSQAWRVARKLEVGMVGINEGIISTPEGAFGGVKESGLGRESSHYGMDEFTNIKYICFGNL